MEPLLGGDRHQLDGIGWASDHGRENCFQCPSSDRSGVGMINDGAVVRFLRSFLQAGDLRAVDRSRNSRAQQLQGSDELRRVGEHGRSRRRRGST